MSVAVPDTEGRIPADGEQARARRRAWEHATGIAARRCAPGGSALATHGYGPTSAVLALAGTFDPQALHQLERRAADLRGVGLTELVVDLGGLTGSDERLRRTLCRLRMRLLVAGLRLQWCRVPHHLATALPAGAFEAFVVDDHPPHRRPAGLPGPGPSRVAEDDDA